MLQQLQDLYRRYDEEATKVRQKSSPADGLFGFGNDPKNHRCHEQFYENVGDWVQAFLAREPDPEQSLAAARFLLSAPLDCSSKESYRMMYAAQGWCRELVKYLDAAGCAELRDLFDARYPRRDRMPVQEALYKSLKKGAGKR